MVPHLKTALNGPLLALEKQIIEASTSIERWFRLAWQDHTPPFYGSVDLRHAGFKLSPVDMNLFPGGFNNLSDEMMPWPSKRRWRRLKNTVLTPAISY